MQAVVIQNVHLSYPKEMSLAEAQEYLRQEQERWTNPKKKLGSVSITLRGEEVEIKAKEKSPIKRMRRITGYVVPLTSMNDAKLHEIADRKIHA